MSGKQQMALTGALIAAVLAGGVGLARCPRLVSFVPQAQMMAQARTAPNASFEASVQDVSGGDVAGLKAEMVKAVMAETSAKGVRQVSMRQGPMQSDAGPVRTNAVLRKAKQRPAAQQQTWVVMTEWSDADVAPQLVYTVQHEVRVAPEQTPDPDSERKQTSQPRFAAVPFANGWLIVQI
jgi:hypothetical protein